MPQFDSSAFWGIAGIIVGAMFSTFLHIIGKKKTLLQYYKSTTPLITEETAEILNASMSIDGQPVKSLYSTTISFVNSGNQRMQSSEFSDEKPLCVILKGHVYGYYPTRGNQPLLPKVKLVNNVLNISFENLKPREFFRVTILHDKTLDILGELTTGTMRQLHDRTGTAVVCLMVALIMAYMLLTVEFVDLLSDYDILEDITSSALGSAIVVAMALLMCILFAVSIVSLRYDAVIYRRVQKNKFIKQNRMFDKTIGRIFGIIKYER